jgi:hypothetical protein
LSQTVQGAHTGTTKPYASLHLQNTEKAKSERKNGSRNKRTQRKRDRNDGEMIGRRAGCLNQLTPHPVAWGGSYKGIPMNWQFYERDSPEGTSNYLVSLNGIHSQAF